MIYFSGIIWQSRDPGDGISLLLCTMKTALILGMLKLKV